MLGRVLDKYDTTNLLKSSDISMALVNRIVVFLDIRTLNPIPVYQIKSYLNETCAAL